jgi:phosphatidylglycerophosphate synthase
VGDPSTPRDVGTDRSARDFYSVNRGGGMYTELVSQRIASHLAAYAARQSWSPALLTLTSLVVSGTASAVLLAAHDDVSWLLALLVGAGWQVAYAFDCADGQLARGTGTVSAAGARSDVLADLLTQVVFVAAISAVARSQADVSVPLLAAFSASWLVGLILSTLDQRRGEAAPIGLIGREAGPVLRTARLLRDGGFLLLLFCAVLAIHPPWVIALIWLMTVLNLGICTAVLVVEMRRAMRVRGG